MEEGHSEKTESEGVEKIEVENVELLINLKKKPKDKKRKAARQKLWLGRLLHHLLQKAQL